MTITLNEKDFSCSNCGHYDTTTPQCRGVTKNEMNPQLAIGDEYFTLIPSGYETSQWCSRWKRVGSLNNPA